MTSPALRDALAALKPFADELDGAWGGLARDHEPIENFTGINIRVGDLRRARKAYEALRANSSDVSVPRERLQTIVDDLNDLTGAIDQQTYDDKRAAQFDRTDDAESTVTITARQERALDSAWKVLNSALSASPQAKGEGDG
jgi:hypothetical protein